MFRLVRKSIKLLQWWHSNTLDLGSNVVFDQRRGLHHQDDSGLMPGFDSSLLPP